MTNDLRREQNTDDPLQYGSLAATRRRIGEFLTFPHQVVWRATSFSLKWGL
jgi:hypothetical protein